MLTKDYKLKIADFGFAAPLQGRDGSGMLTTDLGTPAYMAPEIHHGLPYSGAQVDLFAAAIVLFIMVSQRPPFAHAKADDPHYKMICANRFDYFWQVHNNMDNGIDRYSP